MANWTEKRLKCLELLHKEGFSANVIAGKLGAAFTKSIVLRKLHQLEEERLARAKVIAARKAAKASGLKRASKAIGAPRKVTRGPSPVVQPVRGPDPVRGFHAIAPETRYPSGHHPV
jgi:hypothetical protein